MAENNMQGNVQRRDEEPVMIKPWDSLLINLGGGSMAVTALHVYESGRIKVRCPSGHIVVIDPGVVEVNYGYLSSEYDKLLKLLINQ